MTDPLRGPANAWPEDDASFREFLSNDGTIVELLTSLVALGEARRETKLSGAQQGNEGSSGADLQPKIQHESAVAFLKEKFGQGTLAPFTPATAKWNTTTAEGQQELQKNLELKDRVAELLAELRDTRQKIKAVLPAGILTIFNIAAYGVPDVDVKGGTSDPYLVVSLLDAPVPDEEHADMGDISQLDPVTHAAMCAKRGLSAKTTTLSNCANPVWEDEMLKIVLPAGTPRPPRVLVQVWDADRGKSDDPLASIAYQLQPFRGKAEQIVLIGRNGLPPIEVDFEYKMLETADEMK